jgi:hypothetical protein
MSDTPPADLVLTRLDLYFAIRHTNRAMRLFGRIFDHDYDMAAIFLTVAEVCFQAIFHLAAADPAEINIEQLYTDENVAGMTTLSIAELTGIPRETVRRKLKFLIENNFLAVSPNSKNIYLPAATIRSERFLEPFTSYVKDVGQLVRTVMFYQRGPAD